MKKFLALCFALLFTVLFVPNAQVKLREPVQAEKMAFAEEVVTEEETKESGFVEYYSEQTRLCVVGEASKTLSPDRGIVYAHTSGLGSDCKTAKDEAFERFDKVVEILEENGCDKSKVVIESFHCRPCRECREGCHGNLSFSFVIEDLSKTDEIISAVLEGGVKEISSICYEVSNMEEEYNNLLGEALEKAKVKASSLLGDDCKLVDIREQSVYYSNCIYREYVENQGGYLGGVEVRTMVEATFI